MMKELKVTKRSHLCSCIRCHAVTWRCADPDYTSVDHVNEIEVSGIMISLCNDCTKDLIKALQDSVNN